METEGRNEGIKDALIFVKIKCTPDDVHKSTLPTRWPFWSHSRKERQDTNDNNKSFVMGYEGSKEIMGFHSLSTNETKDSFSNFEVISNQIIIKSKTRHLNNNFEFLVCCSFVSLLCSFSQIHLSLPFSPTLENVQHTSWFIHEFNHKGIVRNCKQDKHTHAKHFQPVQTNKGGKIYWKESKRKTN